jgi:hypothetical protein
VTDGVSGCASAVASEAESAGRAARVDEKTAASTAAYPQSEISVTLSAARVTPGRRGLPVSGRLAQETQLSGVDVAAVHGRTHWCDHDTG